ncbi:MAG: ArsI/CadI family heavy metal resistance metalloenzyme [Fimbriimonas sp.]
MNDSSAVEMLETESLEIEAMLNALGDPSRRRVLAFLRSCPCAVVLDEATAEVRPVDGVTVGEVCCAVPISAATVSQHMKVLREAGLIVTKRDGKFVRCCVDPRALRRLAAYFCATPPAAPEEATCCSWQEESHMPNAKTHLALNVRDLQKSIAFYEAFFGAPVHKRRPGYANFDLESPPLKLALNEDPNFMPRVGSLNHLGIVLESVEAVNRVRARLNATDLALDDEGDTVCCFARQDKVWAHDPDGNAWEVYVILDEMMDGKFEAPPASEVSCCSTAGSLPAPERPMQALRVVK